MNAIEGLNGYEFEEKNAWRGWAWRQIAKRLTKQKIRPYRARVAYLAGLDNLDRDAALAAGFRAHNLLAISRDPTVVRFCRASGITAICCEVSDLFYAWPAALVLDAFLLDFCCGINPDVAATINNLLHSPARRGTPIVINLLRGRDHLSNEIRSTTLTAIGGKKDRGTMAAEFIATGAAFQTEWITSGAARSVSFRDFLTALFRGSAHTIAPGPTSDRIVSRTSTAKKEMQSRSFSYRSIARQTFDSVAMNMPGRARVTDRDYSRADIRQARRRAIAAAAVMTSRGRRNRGE